MRRRRRRRSVPRRQLAQPPRLIKQTQKYLTTLKVCLRVPFVAGQTLIAAARKFISAPIRMPLYTQRLRQAAALRLEFAFILLYMQCAAFPRGLIAQLKAAHSVRHQALKSDRVTEL